jgi:hypothetical protein
VTINTVAATDDFNPAIDATGRFQVPDHYWTYSHAQNP